MRQIWIVLISVLATAGLVGGGTYYFVNKKSDDTKTSLRSQINNLSKKFDDSQAALQDAQQIAEIASSSSISTTPTASSTNAPTTNTTTTPTTADPTSGWKTYTNTTYGYSINYPTDVTVKAIDGTSTGFTLSGQKDPFLQIVVDNLGTIDALALDNIVADLSKDGISFTESTKTTLDGIAAYEAVYNEKLSNYEMISQKNGHVFQLLFLDNTKTTITKLASLKTALTVNEKSMLSSFKFN